MDWRSAWLTQYILDLKVYMLIEGVALYICAKRICQAEDKAQKAHWLKLYVVNLLFWLVMMQTTPNFLEEFVYTYSRYIEQHMIDELILKTLIWLLVYTFLFCLQIFIRRYAVKLCKAERTDSRRVSAVCILVLGIALFVFAKTDIYRLYADWL